MHVYAYASVCASMCAPTSWGKCACSAQGALSQPVSLHVRIFNEGTALQAVLPMFSTTENFRGTRRQLLQLQPHVRLFDHHARIANALPYGIDSLDDASIEHEGMLMHCCSSADVFDLIKETGQCILGCAQETAWREWSASVLQTCRLCNVDQMAAACVLVNASLPTGVRAGGNDVHTLCMYLAL